MIRVFATVGMSEWPFDRLVNALTSLCERFDLFAQIGTSKAQLDCPHERYLPFTELMCQIDAADVVVCHAGNVVRLAQRAGKLPIVLPRERALGEMANDHQVPFATREAEAGRVVLLTRESDLSEIISSRGDWTFRLPLPDPRPDIAVQQLLEAWKAAKTCPCRGPASFYWEELKAHPGRHLHLGPQSRPLAQALSLLRSRELVQCSPGEAADRITRIASVSLHSASLPDLPEIQTLHGIPCIVEFFGGSPRDAYDALEAVGYLPDRVARYRKTTLTKLVLS